MHSQFTGNLEGLVLYFFVVFSGQALISATVTDQESERMCQMCDIQLNLTYEDEIDLKMYAFRRDKFKDSNIHH